ncbi:MAG: sugar transferase [Clostridia bacterium]|nr:sugar transferase [Clostridia bacterium]
MKKAYIHIKYIFDLILSVAGVVALAPVFLIVAIAVKLDSRGPIIFKQNRNGKDGRIFRIYKFRTMTTTTVKFSVDRALIEDNNVNLTRVGRIIRKLKLDELPQLFNVIKGDMSLVGPRPLMPEYLDAYEGWEWSKFNVRPGITGLAQVNGNSYLSTANRNYYDLLYVENLSPWLDLKILFKTVLVVIKGEKRQLRRVSERKIWEMKQYYTVGVNIPIDYGTRYEEAAAADATADSNYKEKARKAALRQKIRSGISVSKSGKNVSGVAK